ncbi:hypothetical protein COUCH_15450 [Couchioplanes caeruleus]|uniref:hypothetical protein n=1 Tax=Couchioplanes caeruleus TaxID=56438 RepID=UPI0020C0AF93|nr:hypothetical protein [Couchioplanes caeruleus]UQU67576.1 hypothetical protein COUCH_15450 [Couchioplanes caeruleus]
MIVAIGAGVISTICATALTYAWGRRFMDLSPYEIISLHSTELVEKVGAHHRYTWTREMVIKARRRDVRLIEATFYWTGRTKKQFLCEPLVGEHMILDGKVTEEDHGVHRWIYLGRPMGRHEEVRTGIRLTFEDDAQAMQCFIRERPTCRIRHLEIRLRFPVTEEPKSVTAIYSPSRGEYSEVIASRSLRPERIADPGMGTVDFVLINDKHRRDTALGMRWAS